jgi:hypothetical protein
MVHVAKNTAFSSLSRFQLMIVLLLIDASSQDAPSRGSETLPVSTPSAYQDKLIYKKRMLSLFFLL